MAVGRDHGTVVFFRDYDPAYEDAWLRCWGRVVVTSHAWGLPAYQQKPAYSRPAVEIVAVDENDPNEIVGFIDVEIENQAGELGALGDSRCGFVWEFGLLPSCRGRGLGRALLERAAAALAVSGVRRMEFWSMDASAQGFYDKMGMREIGRHWRFWAKVRRGDFDRPGRVKVRPEYIHATCSIEDWPAVREEWDVITKPPLEPHICIGFDYRF